MMSLLFVAAVAIAFDDPNLESVERPVISIVYAPRLREQGPLFESLVKGWDGLPIEVRQGGARTAEADVPIFLWFDKCELIGEQRYDQFMETLRLNNSVIWPAHEVTRGWKNVAVQVSYQRQIHVDGQLISKGSDSAVGFAAGKEGSSSDVRLNNDVNSLGSIAFHRAMKDVLHQHLLRLVFQQGPLSPQDYRMLDLDEGDGTLLFPARLTASKPNEFQGTFEIENRLGHDVTLVVNCMLMIRNTRSRFNQLEKEREMVAELEIPAGFSGSRDVSLSIGYALPDYERPVAILADVKGFKWDDAEE